MKVKGWTIYKVSSLDDAPASTYLGFIEGATAKDRINYFKNSAPQLRGGTWKDKTVTTDAGKEYITWWYTPLSGHYYYQFHLLEIYK